MKIVFFIPMENLSKVNNLIYKDDLVSRQSITIREAKVLGFKKEGYYLEIEGSEEAIKRAEEILGDLVKKVDKNEEKEVLEKISEQENSAAEGFGVLFG
ncbi:MAG: hypothetical protein QW051_00925 [Candidatus Aenigmatarchaeota archaeon]